MKKGVLLASGIISGSLLLNINPARASSVVAKGKCGLLLEQSYNDKCTIVVKNSAITLLPGSSSSIRILPQSVSYFSLADKSSMKVDETLALYENIRPWWLGGVPKWVKNAMSERQSNHKIVIGYLDPDFEPSIAILELSDKSKAGGVFSELAKVTGLRSGEYRDLDKSLNPRLTNFLIKDAKRQSRRIAGLCSSSMFDDAEPVLEKLETYVFNRINEISIFRGSEKTVTQLENIGTDTRNHCEQEFKRELAQIEAARRAKLEAIRRKEAQRRAAAAAARARAVAADILKRRASFDNLTAG